MMPVIQSSSQRRSRVTRRVIVPLAATIALVAMSGCIGPEAALSAGLNAVGAQSATFVRGELISATRSPMAATHVATERALIALGMKPMRQRLREKSASTWAVTLDERDIRVALSAVSPSVTSIAVKAGFWGDLALSRMIQEQIDAELKIDAVSDPTTGSK